MTRPSDIEQKKENLLKVNFAVPADHRVKMKESEKRDKYQDLARELKKTMEHEGDANTNCNWCAWYSHQKIGTETGGFENKRMSGDHPNYSIVEIGQNTKNPRDLRRLEETCCHSNSSGIPSALTDVKNSQMSKIMIKVAL